MYGFHFGDPDPNNDVAKRAIKSVLSTHLPQLAPKIRQWVAIGVESQLKAAPTEWGDSMCSYYDLESFHYSGVPRPDFS